MSVPVSLILDVSNPDHLYDCFHCFWAVVLCYLLLLCELCRWMKMKEIAKNSIRTRVSPLPMLHASISSMIISIIFHIFIISLKSLFIITKSFVLCLQMGVYLLEPGNIIEFVDDLKVFPDTCTTS